jgi:hypothetical protein
MEQLGVWARESRRFRAARNWFRKQLKAGDRKAEVWLADLDRIHGGQHRTGARPLKAAYRNQA